mgnify:CR=1 FL=1
MDRTLSMVIVSFVLGALVSITIQACGGDENKFEQDCGMVEAKSVQYQKGYPSGKRYLSFVNHSVYTYSDSGDCRYGRTVSTLYNEDGSVMREDQSSEKMILYIK